MRTSRAPLVPYWTSFTGKMYPGSSLFQVPVHRYQAIFTTKIYKKYDKGTVLLNVHAGTGFKLQQDIQGVINLNLGEEPSLPVLTEAQVEDHIMDVIFAHQYTLKGGSRNLGKGLRRPPPNSSGKFMKWVHINLWMPPTLPKRGKWRHYLPWCS